jgi:hypothetical protein
MSKNYSGKSSIDSGFRRLTDNLSKLQKQERYSPKLVIKCLTTGAFFAGYNLASGVLSVVAGATDARKFTAARASEMVAFLPQVAPGFAWAAVRIGGAQ